MNRQDWKDLLWSFQRNLPFFTLLMIVGFGIGMSIAMTERMGVGLVKSSQSPIRSFTRTNKVTITTRPSSKTKAPRIYHPDTQVTPSTHPEYSYRTPSPRRSAPLRSTYPTNHYSTRIKPSTKEPAIANTTKQFPTPKETRETVKETPIETIGPSVTKQPADTKQPEVEEDDNPTVSESLLDGG